MKDQGMKKVYSSHWNKVMKAFMQLTSINTLFSSTTVLKCS